MVVVEKHDHTLLSLRSVLLLAVVCLNVAGRILVG
jgi:hypothetical protein